MNAMQVVQKASLASSVVQALKCLGALQRRWIFSHSFEMFSITLTPLFVFCLANTEIRMQV